MSLKVGIVGLPNVGKSTLFNALLKKQSSFAEDSAGQAGSGGARVGNFPFTTIEPNVGIVPVPDERLEKLAIIVGGGDPHASLRKAQDDNIVLPPIKPATVEFVDIAGLVKGASEGAGLGNKFLSHIREVQIIAHVVRAFADDPSAGSGQVIIREGSVDPKSDYETINTELILADLQSLEKAISDKKKAISKPVLEKLRNELNKGIPARNVQLSDEEREATKDLFLLSAKPEIIVLNVSEEEYNPTGIDTITQKYTEMLNLVTASETKQSHEIAASPAAPHNDNMVVICAKIESELSELSEEEQKQYLEDLGLQQSGLERLIQKAYEKLNLISFLTAGEKEVRAWTIKKGTKAVDAAEVIHTDFIKKFIKAEVVPFNDFVEFSGWKGSREHGKARLEGKNYMVYDGDVIEFKIGA